MWDYEDFTILRCWWPLWLWVTISMIDCLIAQILFSFRIKGVASEIFRCYATDAEQPEPLVVVCVLKSAFRFFCVLQEELMRLNNDGYDDGTSSYSNGFVDGNENTHAHTNKPALPLLCEFIRVKSYVNTKSDTTCDVQIQGLTNPQESFSSKVRFVQASFSRDCRSINFVTSPFFARKSFDYSLDSNNETWPGTVQWCTALCGTVVACCE